MIHETSTPLIPRKTLFGNPDKMMVKLSPDGERIAYLAPRNGTLNLWVGSAADPESAQPVTSDTGRGIQAYSWTYTNDHLLYIQDEDGDENWLLHSVDLESGESRNLTPVTDVQVRVEKVSPRFPGEILIAINDRDPQFHDIHRLDVRTGKRTLVEQNDGFAGYVCDTDYRVRLAVRITSDGGSEILRRDPDGEGWESFITVSMEDTLTTGPIGFDVTGEVLYMVDSRGRDTAALTRMDFASGETTVLAEDPQADVSDRLVHPTERNVQAVAFNYERVRWQILDDAITDDLNHLRGVAAGDVRVTSRTLDDGKWIVAYLMDDGPLRYYLYDRETKEARFLFTNRKELENVPLAAMKPVIVRARDDLNLVGYATLPLGSDPDGDLRPARPLPMVLLVHGGPWHRDEWGYDPNHQWLANRGYAVLSVNFRGSTGLGKTFINAATGEWAGKMHDDLIDAVNWAVERGIADPERVAIMGGSYGGYATLVGLTFTPDVFACGVDIVGPSNLITLLESMPAYWGPQIEVFTTRVGDHRTEDGRRLLTERSPLSRVDSIRRPLLIGQGANDPRVKQAEADQITRAMQEKNIPVTYVLYPDEGHGFVRPENRFSFNAVTEAFLSRCLGGRCEPIGGDFQGSSIQVPAGASEVPGLSEMLEGE